MKLGIVILCLFSGAVFGADEITDQNEARVASLAGQKSKNVYYGMGRIADLSLGTSKKTNTFCSITDRKSGKVQCTVTDYDSSHGWTEGIKIDWIVSDQGNNKFDFSFELIEKIEH